MSDLQEIIDKIVVIQAAITPPTGEKDVTAYDEPPTSVLPFPCFINAETSAEEIGVWNTSGRTIPYLIDMHLVFAQADQQYSVRSRRAWVIPVLDAFGHDYTLSGAAGVQKAFIETIEFHDKQNGYLAVGEKDYIAATFKLRVIVEEAFDWSP
jgi:hypothetical protein